MTYDELMAAVDLLALEDQFEADVWRSYLSGRWSKAGDCVTNTDHHDPLLAYLPEHAKTRVVPEDPKSLVRVNWTPPKP